MARIAQGGPTLWKKKNVTIAASGSTSVFTQTASSFRGYTAHVSIYDSTNDKLKNFSYMVSKKNSNIVENIYGKIGDVLSYEINSVVSGSQVITTITNNEAIAIQVNFYSLRLI